MRAVVMIGLVVGAYVAGYNEITHVEVIEMVGTTRTYIEGMIEYAERYRGEVSSVVENVTSYVAVSYTHLTLPTILLV